MAYSKQQNHVLEEEKNCKLTYLFRDLLKKRIDFQIERSETRDIVLAVDTLVGTLVAKVTSNNPWLSSFSRLIKVGSIAERTSIDFPDEFDYIVVAEHDGVIVDRTCKWREGYAHIKVTNPYLQRIWKPFLKGDYLRGSFTRDFFEIKSIEFLQYLLSVAKKWLYRNPLVDDRSGSIWSPYFDSLENAFMIEIQRILHTSDENDLTFETKSGTMRVEKFVVNHGPAFMPKFIWTPKSRQEKKIITVDITTGIEVKLSHNPIIKERDVFHRRFWEKLVKHGKYMLIPCHESTACAAGLCFRLTFTETEVELVRSLSHHHKECYKLLKYAFNGGGGMSYIPSYALKTLVIKHDCFCKETANLATCFKTLVASLLYHIFNKKSEERVELSRLMRLFIPGSKFRLNIPSIFIQRHNILGGKDYKVPCEQFLLAIEEMLSSLEKVSTQDKPDDNDLSIVNSHRTAAVAYGLSMLPVWKKQWEFVYCLKCIKEYIRLYGAGK